MADYIYLLQHRLTSTQRRALEAVRDAARGRGAPVFLVGGAVRDLTSGAPVRDLDFAVQGDAVALAETLESAGAIAAGEDPVFLSRFFVFPGGVRVEVGPTLSVSYPKPGEPVVQPAPILDDLRRRDFTANGMAISLNEGSYGLLLDPLNGVADLENRELRLISNLGFIEQPALLLRAARLTNRMGWILEEKTQRRYENAKEEEALQRLSPYARGYELEEIFHEEDPISALEHMEAEGWLQELFPGLTGLKLESEVLDRVRDSLGQMEHLGIFTDPSPVFFPLLTAKLPTESTAALKAAFARPGFARQIDSLETRSRELATQLGSRTSASASASWKLLFAAEPEVVLALASSTRTGALQAKFKAFFVDWPQARQRIPYALMQEMRITPEIAGYAQLLEDLFFALIDGKLTTGEEMRAFLEPFSPPAPAQQTAPRRRAAKSARGRGRQAAAPAIVEPDDPDTDPDADPDDADEDESGDVAPLGSGSRGSAFSGDDDDPEEDRKTRNDDEEDDEDEDEPKQKEQPAAPSTPAAPSRPPTKVASKKSTLAGAVVVVVPPAATSGTPVDTAGTKDAKAGTGTQAEHRPAKSTKAASAPSATSGDTETPAPKSVIKIAAKTSAASKAPSKSVPSPSMRPPTKVAASSSVKTSAPATSSKAAPEDETIPPTVVPAKAVVAKSAAKKIVVVSGPEPKKGTPAPAKGTKASTPAKNTAR